MFEKADYTHYQLMNNLASVETVTASSGDLLNSLFTYVLKGVTNDPDKYVYGERNKLDVNIVETVQVLYKNKINRNSGNDTPISILSAEDLRELELKEEDVKDTIVPNSALPELNKYSNSAFGVL